MQRGSAWIAQVARQQPFHSSALRAFPKSMEHTTTPENLNSLASRLQISFNQSDILGQALTHKSFRYGTVPTNENLIQYGNRVLGFYVATSVPKDAGEEKMKSALKGYNEPKFLASVADNLEIAECLQYQLPPDSEASGITSIKAGSLKALIGAIYHDQGEAAAREFVNKHIFSRKLVL
ncbi:hypothetical protein NQZ79_g4033 [Umbelopsis isabellina]|nr:hypothetical protein NQZ79_g4033 [Umbelopsis isabellina]